MKLLKKNILLKILLFSTLSSFSIGNKDKFPDPAVNTNSINCVFLVTMTDSLVSNTPCSKYKFTVSIIGFGTKFLIKFGDGTKDSLMSFGGTFSFTHQYTSSGTFVAIGQLSGGPCGSSPATSTVVVNCSAVPCPQISSFTNINLVNNTGCQKLEFNTGISGYTGPPCPTSPLVASINYGDGSPTYTTCVGGSGFATTHQFITGGTYTVNLTVTGPGTCIATAKSVVTVTCSPPCADCISSFAPIPGKKYLVSAWVKEKNAPQSKTSYTFPSLTILFPSISGSTPPFIARGVIIDGWQRVEGEFTIPVSATNMSIKLDCSTGDCYFDDVRVLPFDGSMKSYVYDPVTMRLVAELDERNYATLYEYDEEGKLIRVKKETEKGIMTIQENRNNTKK